MKNRNKLLFGIPIILLLLIDLLFVGNAAYYIKWAQCGSQPIILSEPPKIGEGSFPATYYARTNPNWLRIKEPIINSNDNMSYCSTQNVLDAYENVKICESDSLFYMLGSFGVGESCG